MRLSIFACVLVASLFVVSSRAGAQVIYEPIQYQHGGQNVYYYAGSDPQMHRHARSVRNEAGTWGRVNGFAFVSANIDTHREVSSDRPRTFTDALGLREARFYGYTANDARNDAYAAAPTYFRKADLVRSAVLETDGTWSVPANAPRVNGVRIYDISPARARIAPRANESLGAPRPLMIIPKDRLKQPQAPVGKVADAR